MNLPNLPNYFNRLLLILFVWTGVSYGTPPPDASNTYGTMTLTLSGTVKTNAHEGVNSPILGNLTVVLHNNGTDGWVNPLVFTDYYSSGSAWVVGGTNTYFGANYAYSGTIPAGQSGEETIPLTAYASWGDPNAPQSYHKFVVSPTYVEVGCGSDMVYIPVVGSGELGLLYGFTITDWYQGVASLSGTPPAIHVYRNPTLIGAGGRDGVPDRLTVKCDILNEGSGPGTRVQFRVGGKIYEEGVAKEGNPAVDSTFVESIDESEQGGSLKSQPVQLILDGKPTGAPVITPPILPNHSYTVDFGIIRIGEKCLICGGGKCTPGRMVGGLRR